MRRHVPAMTVVRDDAHRLFVVASDHPRHGRASIRMKRDSLADAKFEHGRVRVDLPQKPQPRHDTVIEVDQLRHPLLVDINRHRRSPYLSDSSILRRRMALMRDW